MRLNFAIIGATVALLASPTGAFAASFDGSYSGSAATTGGSKSFCKGNTPIKASVSKGSITFIVPRAEGGPASVRGKVGDSGSFSASGGSFTYKGKFAGSKASGSWKGKSCFGSFAIG